MSDLLRFSGVTLIRGGRLLAEGINVRLAAGDRLLLAGPNGSGKSSLIRLAAGLLRPATGTVERASAALVDDRPALDPELPLRRALGFWTDEPRLGPAMAAMGVSPLADVPVRLLSAGQLKRAALVRVAASDAPLWLLDEPANGLDAEGESRLSALIGAHVAAGGAVLAAAHGRFGEGWPQLELGR